MKKLMCAILTVTMILGMFSTVMATESGTQTITFSEDGTGTVTFKEDTATTDANVSEKKGYIALGQNLSSGQMQTVLALLGVSQQDIGSYDVIYITNAEEHQYLDKYIDSAVIGRNSL